MKKLLIVVIVIGVIFLIVWFSIMNRIFWFNIMLKNEGYHSDPVAENTGWTAGQFFNWGYEVEVVREQKIWKTPRYGEPMLVGPNEPFCAHVMNDINEAPWATEYKYEWKLQVDPNKIPPPVEKVLDSLSKEDAGMLMGEILPYAGKTIAIYAWNPGLAVPVSCEPLEVRLLSLSDDKLELRVETEPFVISDNPEIHGRTEGKVVLYVCEDCRISIFLRPPDN